MRNLNIHKPQQNSKDYYNNVLKKRNTNLNLSKTRTDKTNIFLNKILNVSYSFFAPIFEKDISVKEFKKDTSVNYVDSDFDNSINKISPNWLKQLITIIKSLYNWIFPEKVKKTISQITAIAIKHNLILLHNSTKIINKLTERISFYNSIKKSSP